MTFEYVRIGRPAEYVVHVELHRPDKLNAFVPAMWAELGQAFRQLSRDPDVRAIVLSGAGDRGFTAGLDVFAAGQWMGEATSHPEPARRAAHLRRFVVDFQACISAIEECEKRAYRMTYLAYMAHRPSPPSPNLFLSLSCPA